MWKYKFDISKYKFDVPKYTFDVLKYKYDVQKYKFDVPKYRFNVAKYKFDVVYSVCHTPADMMTFRFLVKSWSTWWCHNLRFNHCYKKWSSNSLEWRLNEQHNAANLARDPNSHILYNVTSKSIFRQADMPPAPLLSPPHHPTPYN